MALLTVQSITKAGVVPTFTAAAVAGDTVPASARFLVVKNGAGAPVTVTITPTGTTTYGAALPAHTVVVTNGTEKWINLNDTYFLNSSSLVPVTYSSETLVTVGAFLD
jgi:hypothetical protein